MFKKITTWLLLPLLLTTITTSFSALAEVQPTINASAGIVIDATTGYVIYSKNADKTYYPASITKLMTTLIVLEELSLDATVTFSETAISSIPYDTSRIGIQPDERLTVNQGLHGMLLMSANEIAAGFAEAISGSISSFADKMNDKAESLGALKTHFTNPHGLHDREHYTTAYDMALISQALMAHPAFFEIMEDVTYQIPATNITDEIRYLSQQHRLMNEIKDASTYRPDVIGGKTGYTTEANNTLVTFAKQGETTLIVVLLDASGQEIYNDTNALLDYGFNTFSTVDMPPVNLTDALPIYSSTSPTSQVGEASIALEDSSNNLTLNKSWSLELITSTLDVPDKLDETISSGDQIGTLSYYYEDQLLGSIKIIVGPINYTLKNQSTPLSSVITGIKTVLNYLIFLLLLLSALYLFLFKVQGKSRRYKDYIQKRRS